jgi:myo-inositol-1-phosphate synthase
VTYFWLEGKGFLDSTTKMDVYLRSEDGPNAGNILLDTIRAVKSAGDRGFKGVERTICSYGFKSHLGKGSVRDSVYNFTAKYVG